MQSLTSLVSLAMLRLPLALESLSELSTASLSVADETGGAPYLLNVAGINELNDVLIEAASVCLTIASPAVFAWGIILQTVREFALRNKEARELRQSQRAAEGYGAADSSDTDTGDRLFFRNSSFRRRSSTGSDTSLQSTFLEDVLERIMDTVLDEDPIGYLAKSAVDGSNVLRTITALAVDFCTPFGAEHHGKSGLKIRNVLLDLIRAALDWIPYQPELIFATLAVLTGSESYWELWDRPERLQDAEPAWSFLNDEFCMQKLYLNALTRFPHESLPFLALCRALAICKPGPDKSELSISRKLQELDSFTCALPPGFNNYDTVREDEDANYICLTEDLCFSNHRAGSPSTQLTKSMKASRSMAAYAQSSSLQVLPRGTVGRVLSENRPFVVLWQHSYSGFEYIGRVLRCASTNDNMSAFATSGAISREVAAAMIDLLNATLSTTNQNTPTPSASVRGLDLARDILERTSDGLDRNQDVVSVVFDIFEDELHRRRKVSETEGPGDILVRCIQFTHALLPVMPDRVWPFLGRSGLLGINGADSQLSNVITSTEMIMGRYDFLLGCVRVYEALIDDAMTHAVSRRIPTKAIARFGEANTLGTGIPQTSMKRIILGFQRLMTDVYQSTMNWKFIAQEQRFELNGRICTIFRKILVHCYSVDDNVDIVQKLTASLVPAAEHLLGVFLRSSVELAVNPLLHIFLEGLRTPKTTLVTKALSHWISQVIAALDLSTTLVEVHCLLGKQQSNLEEKLFQAAPVLAKLYAAHDSYRLPVIKLMNALVRSVADTDAQPPSLLGHLGQGTASHYLEVISVIDQPLKDDALSVSIWKFASAIVSKRQQWFAIFVLTGSTPRETLKDRKAVENSPQVEPILNIALTSLTDIDKLRHAEAMSRLEFVKLAADYWPWVLTTIEQHPDFLKSMTEYLEALGSSKAKAGRTSEHFTRLQIASYIVDILAMYTHHTQQMGNLSFTKSLLPNLTYLVQNAVSVPDYNTSLHRNLRQNFESKYPGCSLTNFKRTILERPTLGSEFYYDLASGQVVLSFDPAWARTKGTGFSDEFVRANINLSLVESQMNLLHSWKSLIGELSRGMSADQTFQGSMIRVIIACLESNKIEHGLQLAIYDKLADTRVELAFTLLQRLIWAKCDLAPLKDVLTVAWDTLRFYEDNIELALQNDGADYYRLLLKILYLALQAHTFGTPIPTDTSYNPPPSTSFVSPRTAETILDILNVIVARGFRALINLLHTSPSTVQPADFVLLTAILRTIFAIPGITRNTTHLLTAFADNQTARCASTLLSWSDQLATDNDPLYGELSILFLLELSSVPTLAESLAVEGILTRIADTNLINYLRQPRGMGPFDSPARLHVIWSRGLLPLFLNLLHAVGAPMAAEIAGVLNSFPSQLTRASNMFDDEALSPSSTAPPKPMTLSMASEAQTLAVLMGVLDSFRQAGASAGIVAADVAEVKWNRAQVLEDLETWLGRPEKLQQAIVPVNETEEQLLRMKPLRKRKGVDNRLEEKVIENLMITMSMIGGEADN